MSCTRNHGLLLQRMLQHGCLITPGLHCFGVTMSGLAFASLNHGTLCSRLTAATCILKEKYFPIFSLYVLWDVHDLSEYDAR